MTMNVNSIRLQLIPLAIQKVQLNVNSFKGEMSGINSMPDPQG